MRLVPRKLNICRWLLPLVVALVVVEIACFPIVLEKIYASKFVSPDRTLAYVGGNIESGDGFQYNGAGKVELNLFSTEYGDTVLSGDKDKVVAPGTGGSDTVQLQNRVTGEVTYTAVFYLTTTAESIPLDVSVKGALTDTQEYPIPEGIEGTQVFRAVSGTLAGGEILNFDIEWEWAFDRGEEGDTEDTTLGTKEDLDDVSIGVAITIEDNNEYTLPLNPDTQTAMYSTGVVVSLVLLAVLLVVVLA